MDPSENILLLLKQAFHYGLQTVNDAIAGHGVTTAQIGVLRQLEENPGLSGADLARRLLITPQGAQLALAGLERRGLIERDADPNHGRILRAYLTKDGRRVTAAAFADAVAAHDKLFSALDDGDRRTLHDLLLRVVTQEREILGPDESVC